MKPLVKQAVRAVKEKEFIKFLEYRFKDVNLSEMPIASVCAEMQKCVWDFYDVYTDFYNRPVVTKQIKPENQKIMPL